MTTPERASMRATAHPLRGVIIEGDSNADHEAADVQQADDIPTRIFATVTAEDV